jgi:outer membrane receptor protein involved in Fe transport
MQQNSQLRRAVRHTLLISALAGTSTLPAYAQDAEIEQIVVTGSRIKMANLEGTSPVTQVTSADIQTQGVTRVEDLINQLPQAFAAQNANVSNGSTGTATVDLRGLGSARTLVLVDGRRLPYGGVTNSAADLNQIPAAMVERVEVLTGGASAVYGSDAIGGVVNFIMKKDFEGVQFDAQYGFYQHNNDFTGDGQVKLRDVIKGRAATNPTAFRLPGNVVTDGAGTEFNVLMGVSTEDGRGNITAYAGVRDNDEVLQRDRDYSVCSLSATRGSSTNPNAVRDLSHRCGGSATSYPGYFYTGGAAFTIDSATGNTFRPFDASTDLYNFGPTNHYQRPDRRYSLGAMGHYELTDFADVYTQLMFTDYTSIAQIAPGGNFFNSNVVNCDNPFLSAQQQATLGCSAADIAAGNLATLYVARRNVEGGGRQQSFENSSFRALVGVRGAINDSWDYDTSVQYSKVKADQQTLNYFKIDRIGRSMLVVSDPNTGAPVCQSVLDGTDPACVPYNVFQIGGVTQEALDYLQVPGLQQGSIDQTVYQGVITGDLSSIGLKSPMASQGVGVVFGAEYRKDKLTNTTDELLSSAQLSGTGGATIGISGETAVTDLFTEINIPLLEGVTFADSLGIDAAYRYSDYDSFTTDTYKVGLEWAPIGDIKFRGSYQKAVRAANVVELFTAQGLNLFDMAADPCGADAAGTDAAASDAACLATGVPANQLRSPSLDSPAGQYNFLQGGNPDLAPEESETVTFGLILQPRFLPKLAMSVDYFDIEITDTISTYGANNTITDCYFAGDAASCARINRDDNGNLWRGSGFVTDLNINIGSLQTKGIDLNLNYSGFEIGTLGSLSFNMTGTYLDELVTVPGSSGPGYDCKGFFSGACGTPKPEWRHHARLGWQTPWSVDLSLTWRYIDSVEEYLGDPIQIDYELDSANYFDLAANWAVTEKASILVGINNVLDSDPDISSAVGTTGNGNTFPQTYDSLGRWIFVRAQVGF